MEPLELKIGGTFPGDFLDSTYFQPIFISKIGVGKIQVHSRPSAYF